MSTKNKRKRLMKQLKIFIAAHHYVYISKDIDEIAAAANVSPERIKRWMKQTQWRVSLTFLTGISHVNEGELIGTDGDIAFAERTLNKLNRSGSLIEAERRWMKQLETYQPEPVTDIPILSLEVK